MRIKYLKRGILWITELLRTLLIFWVKNPKETPAIFRFMLEKVLAVPKFFFRNILLEKHLADFKQDLNRTVRLYKRIGESFNPEISSSYQELDPKFKSKSQILYFLIRKLKPKTVLETGVAAGESTGYILQAFKDNGFGKLYSIDLPFQWYIYGNSHTLHLDSLPAGKTPGYLIPNQLKKSWQLIIGKTYDNLPKLLEQLGVIDIFIHDSEHTEKTMTFEYKTSWPYIKKGGLLISDDVEYTKAFGGFSKKMGVKIVRFKDLGIVIK